MSNKNKRWSSEEIQSLKDMTKMYTIYGISQNLERSEKAIKYQLVKLYDEYLDNGITDEDELYKHTLLTKDEYDSFIKINIPSNKRILNKHLMQKLVSIETKLDQFLHSSNKTNLEY